MGLLTESCCCWLHLHFWKGEAGVSMQCSNLVLFILPHVILQDLSVKIARSGFKWCSPVLSAGSVPHHQVVWKYPLPSVYDGGGQVGVWWEKLEFGWHCFSCWSAQETAVFPCMAWNGVGSWTLLLFRAKQWWKLQNSEFATIILGLLIYFDDKDEVENWVLWQIVFVLVWPRSIRCLALLKVQSCWVLYVALLLNGDSKDKWPAWCFYRDILCTNHVSLTAGWRLLGCVGFGPYLSTGLRKVALKLQSTVLGPGSLLPARDWNLVSGL